MYPTDVPVGEPYALRGSKMVFAGWQYIRPGRFAWTGADGAALPLGSDAGDRAARFRPQHCAFGLRLHHNLPRKTGPLMPCDKPWETDGMNVQSILMDGGRYRMWATSSWGDLGGKGVPVFAYYESDDGYDYRRPNLGLCGDFAGGSNVIGRRGGTVFLDAGDEGRRYKWISEAAFSGEEYEKYVKAWPGRVDPKSYRRDCGFWTGARGAHSPDGIRWTEYPLPLIMNHTDTHVTAYYDEVLGKYVAYFRDWTALPRDAAAAGVDRGDLSWIDSGRRAIGRGESGRFDHFDPRIETVLTPDHLFTPNQTLYTNCHTTMPGSPELHLFFPAVWDQANDATHIGLACSMDGKTLHWIDRGPVIDTGAFGGFDGGCVFAVPNLLRLPDGCLALPYVGYSVPHKYPRRCCRRNLGFALWDRERLVGIRAEDGGFTTVAVTPPGRRIRVNADIRRGGHLSVAVLDGNLRPVPGRGADDCIPLEGDCYDTPCRWSGHDDLGVDRDQAVAFAVRLRHGILYSIGFE